MVARMVQNIAAKETLEFSAPETGAAVRLPDRVLDITAEVCPMTFVRTRLALDALQPGQVLEVRLRGEEPRERVPATAEALGHRVLGRTEQAAGVLSLMLLRA